jgi:hypothetical protein
MSHVHRFRLHWLLPMGIPDTYGWYRVVLHGTCGCGASWVMAGECNTDGMQRRITAEGQ